MRTIQVAFSAMWLPRCGFCLLILLVSNQHLVSEVERGQVGKKLLFITPSTHPTVSCRRKRFLTGKNTFPERA